MFRSESIYDYLANVILKVDEVTPQIVIWRRASFSERAEHLLEPLLNFRRDGLLDVARKGLCLQHGILLERVYVRAFRMPRDYAGNARTSSRTTSAA
ncbi:MAG TPA: hypothetical protein VF713_11460 [Thermoanaerobaculia bacterium]